MNQKKVLKKIRGNSSKEMSNRMIKTGLSQPEIKQYDDRFGKKSFQEKKRGYWPETFDMEIYGKK